jgi:hypothetical protein
MSDATERSEQILLEVMRLTVERKIDGALQALRKMGPHALRGIVLVLREVVKLCELELWRRNRGM